MLVIKFCYCLIGVVLFVFFFVCVFCWEEVGVSYGIEFVLLKVIVWKEFCGYFNVIGLVDFKIGYCVYGLM